MLSTLCRMLNEFVIVVTLGAWGELVNDVLPAVEESKGASCKERSSSNHHLVLVLVLVLVVVVEDSKGASCEVFLRS